MAGELTLEVLLTNPEVHAFLKKVYGAAIPDIQAPTRRPDPPVIRLPQPTSPSPPPARPAARAPRTRSRSPLLQPRCPSIVPQSNLSRQSSMDTLPPPEVASEAASASSQESDGGPDSSADDGFSVVTGKKRRRKVKTVPSKAPKTAPSAAPTGPLRPPTPPPSGAKVPLPPPLFIQDKTKWTEVSKWCNEHRINFRSARSTQQGIKVQVTSSSDFRALTRVLKDRNVSFHTYTLPEERLLRVVIRGVPKEIPVSEVKDSLTSENLPVHEVHRMVRARRHEPYDMVLVSLDLNEAGKAIFKLTSVCNLSGITIEPPRKRGFVSQCHRCQLYGHSARNCFARPRCVKCLGDHATAECRRPKDRALCDEPPACVLCGQTGHPANYRGCPRAPRSTKAPSASPQSRSMPVPRVLPSTPLSPQRPSPWKVLNSQSAFPPLPSQPQSRAPSQPVPPTTPVAAPLPPGPAPRAQNTVRPAPNPKKPANKAGPPATNPSPAPVPVHSASPNAFESDLELVIRFASLLDYAEVTELATAVKRSTGNQAAITATMLKFTPLLTKLMSFRVNP